MTVIKQIDFTTMDKLPEEDWNIQVGERWANNEVQQYVNDDKHLIFDNGLVIRATNDNGIIKSARINTKHKVFFQYGKIEITAKLPSGKGTWPALWMMSEDNRYGHWPFSGEIDIMEHTANNLNELFLCLHTKKYNHKKPKDQYYKTLQVENLTEDFHTFGLIWEEDFIAYLFDGKEVVRYHRGEDGKDATWEGWPFDHPYYLLINLAIGGTFGGKVDYNCFPQDFIIKQITISK
jgi:beta-glucanase (GH16 family)